MSQQHGAPPLTVPLQTLRLADVTRENAQGFVESDGYVAIEAADTTARTSDSAAHWEELPGYGETRSAMTVFPVTADSNTSSDASLQYRMYLYDSGNFEMQAVLCADFELRPRAAVYASRSRSTTAPAWSSTHSNTIRKAIGSGRSATASGRSRSRLRSRLPGYHTLKFWMVDPGVVLERIVLANGNLRPSYLGPPESFHSTLPPASPPAGGSSASQ